MRFQNSLKADIHAEWVFEKDDYIDNRSCKSRLLRVHLKCNVSFVTVNEIASPIFSNSSEKWPASFYSWRPTSSYSAAVITTTSSATPTGLFLIILCWFILNALPLNGLTMFNLTKATSYHEMTMRSFYWFESVNPSSLFEWVEIRSFRTLILTCSLFWITYNSLKLYSKSSFVIYQNIFHAYFVPVVEKWRITSDC